MSDSNDTTAMSAPERREVEVYNATLSLPAEQRTAYLDRVCADDDTLRRRVEKLLKVEAIADTFFCELPIAREAIDATQKFELASKPFLVSHEEPGTQIGHYKLLDPLGEGGMGVVWMAQQDEPVSRRVALKIIRLGMDTRSVVARFEAERQALALMDHPNIARVFDGGATDKGRPYFVMELVRGYPLTKYCDENNLSTQQRLELFIQVCHAIQHAHQKGIIHRDLKPSNILITLHDDAPTPKVIDFGIAKATQGRLTDKTLFTDCDVFMGTPAYCSPEQVHQSGIDVDTRSDIYSLGVILYELLTGKTPFDSKELMDAGLDEMRRVLREQEPLRPSTRVKTLRGDELTTAARRRKLDPPQLISLLNGDLDWIVMKCLEKDRARRYDTANGLALDIRRYLNYEPVIARPPSTVYLLAKLMRRHKGPFAAAAMIALTLVGGIVASSWYAVQATHSEKIADDARGKAFEERDRALKAEKQAREDRDKAIKAEALAETESAKALAQKKRADEEAATARGVSEFLQLDILAQAGPDTQVEEGLDVDPNLTVRAALDRAAQRIGNRFANQPLIEAAIRMTLAETYKTLGESAAQKAQAERAYQIRERVLGPEHELTLMAMNSLVGGLKETGATAEAVSLGEKSLELCRRVLGPRHPGTLNSLSVLAIAYQAAKQLEKSVPLYEESLRLTKEVLGPRNPAALNAMHNLSYAYMSQGRYDLAVTLLEEAVKGRQELLGPKHRRTLNSMSHLARAYKGAGRDDLALALLEQTYEGSKQNLGLEHARTLDVMNNLNSAYQSTAKPEQSVPLLEDLLKTRQQKFGPAHSETLSVMLNLARAYRTTGRLDDSARLYEQTLPLLKTSLGPENGLTLSGVHGLAETHEATQEYSKAEVLFRECLELRKKKGLDDWPRFNTESGLGGALLGQRKFAEAEPHLLAGYEGMKKRAADIPPTYKYNLPLALTRLVRLYTDWGKPTQAADWQKQLTDYNESAKPVAKQ